MPITIKQITLWRTEVANKPGALAGAIEPPATAGADFQVIMGYKHPSARGKAIIEVFPVTGRKLAAAAATAGLGAADIPTLLVEGDDRPGLGHAVAQSIGGGGINIHFFVAQVIGSRFSAVIGFGSGEDAKKAASLIKKAAASRETRTGSTRRG